ncbi:MAG: ketoacyl-ACP synthase III [Spirochaetales bacterium]|nr:ketoacyl-ACP synthase III [Spirochaetales bacterium]
MGHFHPENVLDNAFFESLDIGTDDQWITERVGIHTRRTVLPLDYIRSTYNADPRAAHEASLYTNAQTGAQAARMALGRARLTPADIGLVIAGGCSPQYTIPAEACQIAAELGIEATCFDLNSACSSFVAGLHFILSQRPETLPDYILLVNPENTTRTIDYRDRSSAVLWGDGTSAAILSTRVPSAFRVTKSTLHSDPSGWSKVKISTGGHFTQNGSAVQAFAIRKSSESLREMREHLNHPQAYFIGHQANLTMLSSVCERLEVPPHRHLYNVDQFGNCGAAGAPGVLSQNWERFVPGDAIALVVVGSGLTWGGIALQVSEEKP